MEVESWTVNCEEINEETFEMGTFNWEYHHMKPYTYAWGASFQNPHTPWNKDGTSDFIDVCTVCMAALNDFELILIITLHIHH